MNKLMTRIVAAATVSSLTVVGMPVANALPETFSSPPKSHYWGSESYYDGGTDAWTGCTRRVSHTHSYANGNGWSRSGYGVDTFSKRYEDRTEFFVRANLDGTSERVPKSLEFTIEIENRDSRPLTYSVVSVPVGQGEGVQPTHEVPLPPTSGSVKPGKKSPIHVSLGESGLPVYEYGPEAPSAQTKVWMYKITVPRDPDTNLAFLPTIRGALRLQAEPWPFENANCLSLAPIQQEDLTVTANGEEQKTGLFIPALAYDRDSRKRIETDVLHNGRAVKGARTVIQDSGEVWISIPEGALGTDAEGETKNVELRFYAKPRPETEHLGLEYAERMELRDGTDLPGFLSYRWGYRNEYITEEVPIYSRSTKVLIPAEQVQNEVPGKSSAERLSSERSPLWWLLLIPLAGAIGFVVQQWVKTQQDLGV